MVVHEPRQDGGEIWRIFYAGGLTVTGLAPEAWVRAPDTGVLVVQRMRAPDRVRWSCDGIPIRDRELWTGEDIYDPFGWGPKEGVLVSDEEYLEAWRRACGF